MKYSDVDKRNCFRCGAETHMSAEAQPHLCADVKKRRERQERMVQEVMKILSEYRVGDAIQVRETSERIVKVLRNLNVGED